MDWLELKYVFFELYINNDYHIIYLIRILNSLCIVQLKRSLIPLLHFIMKYL